MKTCIHSSVVSTLLALGFSICSVSGEWTEVVVGAGRGPIRFGDGRNDGITRMYVGGGGEYSWSVSTWSRTNLANGDGPVATGAARTDGIKRVYAIGSGYLFENTYLASLWNESKRINVGLVSDVVLLAGRNDGVLRLYDAGYSGRISESTWNQATANFSNLSLPSGPSSLISRLISGDGRNDGVARLYGNTESGVLCEWSFTGTWAIETTNLGLGPLNSIAIGKCRADGLNRLYVAATDGHVYEVWRDGEVWRYLSLGLGSLKMSSIAVGDARGDGIPCVYATNDDGRVYEFKFHNGTWSQSVVEQNHSGLQQVEVGSGRGDGVKRLYVTDGSNLSEYTYTPTTSAPFAAQLLPNGILEWSSTPGGVYDVEWSSDLTTWRSDWSTLTGIPATGTSTQKPIPRFFRVKQRTE
jgi:hypothetical protein